MFRFLDRRRRRPRSRGQSLAEFALALPLMLMLMLIALDFGRIYLGWINLQNMSRIAANFAANNPTAWASGDAKLKTQYQNQVREDALATNCQLPIVAGTPTAPDPTFTDVDGDGKSTGIGDTTTVRLSCSFGVITPFISTVLGGTVSVGSSAVFPVKSGMTGNGAVASTPPPAPTAAFIGNLVINTDGISGAAPFTVDFRDTSGGAPTIWNWNFGGGISLTDGQATSTLRDPLNVLFTAPGTYTVTLVATNISGSSTATMTVVVTALIDVDFTMTPSSGSAPLAVQFQDASTPGGLSSSWTFGTGQGSGSGWTTSHTYNTANTYTVTHTVTYLTGPVSRTKTITIGAATCTAPSLNGVKRNLAQAVWTAAGFTGTVSDGPNAPSGNYTINAQDLRSGDPYFCTASLVVNKL
jgi:PKD repeat protein